jgi:hypothetical protein
MSMQLQPIQQVLQNRILAGQAIVGSVGALAFIAAFTWKMTAVNSTSVNAAKQWIGDRRTCQEMGTPGRAGCWARSCMGLPPAVT